MKVKGIEPLHIANEIRMLFTPVQIQAHNGIIDMVVKYARELRRRNASELRELRRFYRLGKIDAS